MRCAMISWKSERMSSGTTASRPFSQALTRAPRHQIAQAARAAAAADQPRHVDAGQRDTKRCRRLYRRPEIEHVFLERRAGVNAVLNGGRDRRQLTEIDDAFLHRRHQRIDVMEARIENKLLTNLRIARRLDADFHEEAIARRSGQFERLFLFDPVAVGEHLEIGKMYNRG